MSRSVGFRHHNLRRRQRQAKGQSLVEVLIALICAAIFMAALGTDMSQMSVMGERSQQQFLAADLAQEVIDNVRNTTWADLSADAGNTYTMAVNSNNGVSTPTVLPRYLLLDMNTFAYQSPSLGNGALINEWNPLITLTLSAPGGQLNDQITATVTVSWGTVNGKIKTYSTHTVVSNYGVHQ